MTPNTNKFKNLLNVKWKLYLFSGIICSVVGTFFSFIFKDEDFNIWKSLLLWFFIGLLWEGLMESLAIG